MSSEAFFLTSTIETPFNISETVETSRPLKSEIVTTGRSNSMKKLSCDSPFDESVILLSGTFLAVKIPDSVEYSIVLEFIKPDWKRMWEAAKVA